MTKVTKFGFVFLSLVLSACLSFDDQLDDQLDNEFHEQSERLGAEPVAKDFYGNVMSGQIWSTPPGQTGLGGIGSQVSLGELELESEPAQQAVLSLGLQNLEPNVAIGDGRIYGVVKYGIGSASQNVILDWALGQSISLPVGKATVTAVQVDAKGVPLLPMPSAAYTLNPFEVMNTRLVLTASLAAGDRTSSQSPTLTQSINLFAGVGVRWEAPARAKAVIVGDPRGQVLSDVEVTVVGALGQNMFFLVNPADSAIRTSGVVLHGGTDSVFLLSPGGIIGVVLCWLLDG
jgi:hypothetical protein